jgi:hypothetical protein
MICSSVNLDEVMIRSFQGAGLEGHELINGVSVLGEQ